MFKFGKKKGAKEGEDQAADEGCRARETGEVDEDGEAEQHPAVTPARPAA